MNSEKKRLRRRLNYWNKRVATEKREVQSFLDVPCEATAARATMAMTPMMEARRERNRILRRMWWNKIRRGDVPNYVLEDTLKNALRNTSSDFLTAISRMPWRKCSGREGY